jgi:hypothetical protein
MALVKAVLIGGAAAVAIPFIDRGGTGLVFDWLSYGVVHVSAAGWHLAWSWPVFCVVTLFAWAMLGWSNR